MNWIPGQPVLFTTSENDDCCPDCWNQKVFSQDYIQWQFNVPPCFNTKPATKNCFFEDNTEWDVFQGVISAGLLYLDGSASFARQSVLTIGTWYGIELNVNTLTEGFELSFVGFETDVVITQPGLYSLFFKALSPVGGIIVNPSSAQPDEDFGAATISQFCATATTEPTFKLLGDEGQELAGAEVVQVRNGEFVTFIFNVQENGPLIDDQKFFSFELTETCDSVTETWTSEIFEVVADNNCYMQFAFCGNIAAFDFTYFTPTIRIDALFRHRYAYDSEFYRGTTGFKANLYTDREKIYEVRVIEAPEHVNDFFSMFPLAQSISARKGYKTSKNYISYEAEVGIEEMQGSDELFRLTLTLQEQNVPYTNYFNGIICSSSIPPKVLGTEDGKAILTEDDELILVE